jgi:hypothetical protein
VRSYQDFALGLALLLFAAAVVRTVGLSRPIAYLMGLSGLTYLVQGWVIGAEGFSGTHSTLILVACLQPSVDDLAGHRRLAHAGFDGPSRGRCRRGPPRRHLAEDHTPLTAGVPVRRLHRPSASRRLRWSTSSAGQRHSSRLPARTSRTAWYHLVDGADRDRSFTGRPLHPFDRAVRTSPTANTPGTLVSNGNGARGSRHPRRHVAAGQDEATVIHLDDVTQPPGVRCWSGWR